MGVRFAAAIAVALLWVAQAHSQGEGFEWWFDGPKITDTRDPDAACLKILIGAQGGYGYGEHQISHEGRRSNGSPKVRCLGDSFHPSHRPRGELFDFGLMYNRCKPVGGGATVPNENCGPDSPYQREPPPPCPAGVSHGADLWAPSTDAVFCVAGCEATYSAGIKVQLGGSGNWHGEAVNTGRECQPGQAEHVQSSAHDSECVIGNGKSACLSNLPSEANCGYVNEVRTCLDTPPPGGCRPIAGGGYVCDGATAPPIAPGEPAAELQGSVEGDMDTTGDGQPDSTINVKVYGGGPSPITGADGEGVRGSSPSGSYDGRAGNSEGEGDDGTGLEELCPDGNCGAGVETPELEAGESYESSASDYVSRIGAAPIIQAVYDMVPSSQPGQCPTASFQAFGSTHSMDFHCTLENELAMLSPLFLLGWCFVAVLLLMKA